MEGSWCSDQSGGGGLNSRPRGWADLDPAAKDEEKAACVKQLAQRYQIEPEALARKTGIELARRMMDTVVPAVALSCSGIAGRSPSIAMSRASGSHLGAKSIGGCCCRSCLRHFPIKVI